MGKVCLLLDVVLLTAITSYVIVFILANDIFIQLEILSIYFYVIGQMGLVNVDLWFAWMEQLKNMVTAPLVVDRTRRHSDIVLLQEFMRLILLVTVSSQFPFYYVDIELVE